MPAVLRNSALRLRLPCFVVAPYRSLAATMSGLQRSTLAESWSKVVTSSCSGSTGGTHMPIRTFFLALSCFVIASLLAWPPASASPQSKYQSCSELRERFPNGIARTPGDAAKAVSRGRFKPKVDSSAYAANRHLEGGAPGYLCTRRDVAQTAQTVPAPLPSPPQPVANLTASAKAPTRQSTVVDFSISWQVPSAADVSNFVVRLPDGSSKTVYPAEGAPTTPDIKTFTVQAFAPFATSVTVTVIANNAVGSSAPSTFTFATPPEPKRTVTVEITAGTGECASTRDVWRFCYIVYTNQTGGREEASRMGSWSYEARPGLSVTAYVTADAGNPSTCTIRFDGVLVSEQTATRGAWCSAVVPR